MFLYSFKLLMCMYSSNFYTFAIIDVLPSLSLFVVLVCLLNANVNLSAFTLAGILVVVLRIVFSTSDHCRDHCCDHCRDQYP